MIDRELKKKNTNNFKSDADLVLDRLRQILEIKFILSENRYILDSRVYVLFLNLIQVVSLKKNPHTSKGLRFSLTPILEATSIISRKNDS